MSGEKSALAKQIQRYYDEHVRNLNPKFKRYSLSVNSTVICPLHDDNDPSLGIIGDRFHCFGCGAWGNVVDLYIKVNRKYRMRTVTTATAVSELESLLGEKVDLGEDGLKEPGTTGVENAMMRRFDALSSRTRGYGHYDFELAMNNPSITGAEIDAHIFAITDLVKRDD